MNTQDTVHRKSAAELRIRRVMDALEKNNMQAYYAPTCADAVKIAKELLQPGDVISCGGSVTLDTNGAGSVDAAAWSPGAYTLAVVHGNQTLKASFVKR